MKVLYHASPDKNLEVIEPKHTLSHDKYIGDYVFATADKKLAAMYLATKGYAVLMEPAAAIIFGDENEYLKNDRGGAIYSLPFDNFEKTPQAGLEKYEFVCKTGVKPLGKEIYETSIEAMKEQGVKIYFVNQDKFDEILNVKGKSRDKLIQELKPLS